MRKKIVAGNWKMNTTPAEAVALINQLKPSINSEAAEVILCVPAVSLTVAVDAVKGTNIGIGAQNMFYENSGAYTGEISASMLTSIDVKYVVIGHSERRQYFCESDEIINKKVLKAFESGLLPIICCGETLEQRELGVTIDHIRMQMKYAFKNVSAEDAKKSIVAYEPIWAIGTGKVATDEQAEEVCKAVRECIADIYDAETAEAVRVLYGGSVNGGNAAALFKKPNIDGGLVGGASLKAEFGDIVKAI